MKIVNTEIEGNKLQTLSVIFYKREIPELHCLIESSDSEFLDDLYEKTSESAVSLSYTFNSYSLRALIDVIEYIDTDMKSLYTLTTYKKYVK